MFNELHIRGQAIRDGWCVVDPTYYCCLLPNRISARTQQSKFANFQSPPNPHPGALQHCESSASRLAAPGRL